eukprot:TRINITY_DN6351_c0_g2_i2.p1 TRINITY_DN6351_c0_g2~~TRINITY_DN6351_c0_g2_i2.p1  ORF type:complete len:149 (+),score=12.88 TRINITY_DN6351_c0_g2_i2:2325-2771(+)
MQTRTHFTAKSKRRVSAFTYLRLSEALMKEQNLNEFARFVCKMHAGLDYHPELEKYFNPRVNLQSSKPKRKMKDTLEAANTESGEHLQQSDGKKERKLRGKRQCAEAKRELIFFFFGCFFSTTSLDVEPKGEGRGPRVELHVTITNGK